MPLLFSLNPSTIILLFDAVSVVVFLLLLFLFVVAGAADDVIVSFINLSSFGAIVLLYCFV